MIYITKFELGQENEISTLIRQVYNEFVAPDYSMEGNHFFYNWIDAQNIANRQIEQNQIFVACDDTKIVGMIETRNNDRVSLLFVDKAYQNQGIARNLFTKALNNCKSINNKLSAFYVHASPYSFVVYKKLGFVETDSMQEEIGIKYVPMELKL